MEPKIRFKGFRNEWEAHTLDMICKKASSILSENSLGGNLGKYPVYGASGYIQNITTYDFDREYVGLIKDGSGVGRSQLYPAFSSILGTMQYILPKDDTNVSFLSYLLQTIDFSIYVTGSSIPHIYFKDYCKKVTKIPLKEEQKKIANYFKNLDSFIQSTSKKIESLKQVKAASLQAMFPQEGETKPRVRFKGFEGEWEKITFGDLLTFERPDNYIVSNDDYSDKYSTPVLTANKGFILGYTNEKRTYNNPCVIFDDFTLDCKYVNFPFMVKSSALKILTLKNHEEDNIYFVYTLLNLTKIEKLGHARHYISVVQPTQVLIPTDKKEQQAIADYFTQLDSQIALQSQRLEKLKQIKSACLDNMFV